MQPKIRAAFVDEPLAVATNAGFANTLVFVKRDLLWLGDRQAGGIEVDLHTHDVRRTAEVLTHVVEELAVLRPHGSVVLAVEARDEAVVGTVGVANPNIVIGRAAIALAIP